MLRVLTLATLFPDSTRPRFGPFVERQTMGMAAMPDVEVRVVAPIGMLPLLSRYRDLGRLPESEDWKGLTVHRPRFLHVPGGRFDAKLMARALVPVLRGIRKEFAFDVIDAEFFFPDGPAAVALGKVFCVPVSIKARGADIHLWGSAGPTRRQVLEAGLAADGMLCVSAAMKEDMVALGMPGDRIAVHYTGVDRSIFRVRDRAAAKAGLGIDGPLLVGIGALIERKGHDLAIAALAELPGATLVLIGDGPDRKRLEGLPSAGGNVVFLGSVGSDVISNWLAAADVMVLMSASEGLANAWVEALASGTPVVISDVGGAREVLDRPEAGRLVAREPSAVARAIRQLLDSPPDREAIAATAARFSWETNALQLRDHLRGLL